jgi:hypothetical protein
LLDGLLTFLRGTEEQLHSRRISLIFDGFYIFLGALLGMASNYATNSAGAPYGLRLLQRWSLPLVGILVFLMVCGRVWLYHIEPAVPRSRSIYGTGRGRLLRP